MKAEQGKNNDTRTALPRKVLTYIIRHPVLSGAGAAALLLLVVLVCVMSCGRRETYRPVSEDGFLAEAEYWKEDENGFRYYDRDDVRNTYGIDVSEWVEQIDFGELKRSGVQFVIFRAGYRGYETGKFVQDTMIRSWMKQAHRAGLSTGAYFVSQAVNEEEAVEEARFVMDLVGDCIVDMPLYIDLEPVYDEARTDVLDRAALTDIAVAFCQEVEANGYRGGVYANESWFTDKLEFDRIRDYDIWLARYTDRLSSSLPINMWQFTNEGLVPGCDMWVDLNVRVDPLPEETEDTGDGSSES